jgi:hypothetical protein
VDRAENVVGRTPICKVPIPISGENGSPLERPEIFEGRKLEDVKGEELAALKRDAQKRTIDNFAGPLHAPEGWWQPDLNMTKGSQAWLVVDPPNGKIPPF